MLLPRRPDPAGSHLQTACLRCGIRTHYPAAGPVARTHILLSGLVLWRNLRPCKAASEPTLDVQSSPRMNPLVWWGCASACAYRNIGRGQLCHSLVRGGHVASALGVCVNSLPLALNRADRKHHTHPAAASLATTGTTRSLGVVWGSAGVGVGGRVLHAPRAVGTQRRARRPP